jgi:hypothetical protein
MHAWKHKGRIAAVEMVALARWCQRSPIVELRLGAVHPGNSMAENNSRHDRGPEWDPQIPNIRPRPNMAKHHFGPVEAASLLLVLTVSPLRATTCGRIIMGDRTEGTGVDFAESSGKLLIEGWRADAACAGSSAEPISWCHVRGPR